MYNVFLCYEICFSVFQPIVLVLTNYKFVVLVQLSVTLFWAAEGSQH